MNSYIEYDFVVKPIEISEALIAELGEVGFESFMEKDNGFLAYIQENLWKEDVLRDIYVLENSEFDIKYSYKKIEPVNWNEEWEKNFSPIVVEDKCTVRAMFHNKGNTQYEIIINPKMSFGTGHHETTYMMLQNILGTDVEGKKVLDMGCGTGILAIMCAIKGAKSVDAIDVDDWCVVNAKENIDLNGYGWINVILGDSKDIRGKKYDVIIANINRNVLLDNIPCYVESMNTGGELLLSGFYSEDIEVISKKCEEFGLEYKGHTKRNNWVACRYIKK